MNEKKNQERLIKIKNMRVPIVGFRKRVVPWSRIGGGGDLNCYSTEDKGNWVVMVFIFP